MMDDSIISPPIYGSRSARCPRATADHHLRERPVLSPPFSHDVCAR